MSTEQYKLAPGAYAVVKKRTLITSILMLAVISIPFIINYAPIPGNQEADPQKLTIVLLLMAIILPFSIMRLLRKQKKATEDFTVVIDDNAITINPSLPGSVTLSRIEITQIFKNPEGGFIIRGGMNNTVITIPAQVENKERLEARLNELSPVVTSAKGGFLLQNFRIFLIAVVVLLVFFISASNKIVIGILGPLLLLTFAYFFMLLNKNKQNASATRVKLWLLLPTLGIITKMLYILTGLFK